MQHYFLFHSENFGFFSHFNIFVDVFFLKKITLKLPRPSPTSETVVFKDARNGGAEGAAAPPTLAKFNIIPMALHKNGLKTLLALQLWNTSFAPGRLVKLAILRLWCVLFGFLLLNVTGVLANIRRFLVQNYMRWWSQKRSHDLTFKK